MQPLLLELDFNSLESVWKLFSWFADFIHSLSVSKMHRSSLIKFVRFFCIWIKECPVRVSLKWRERMWWYNKQKIVQDGSQTFSSSPSPLADWQSGLSALATSSFFVTNSEANLMKLLECFSCATLLPSCVFLWFRWSCMHFSRCLFICSHTTFWCTTFFFPIFVT